jgi:hypothetical protein
VLGIVAAAGSQPDTPELYNVTNTSDVTVPEGKVAPDNVILQGADEVALVLA